MSAPRCEMTGKCAAYGWQHRAGWRCTNAATLASSGQRLCAPCLVHLKQLGAAEIATGKMRLAFVRSARKLKP